MDEASSAGQKTISGAHVFKALEGLDLEEFIPRLKEEFQGKKDPNIIPCFFWNSLLCLP